MENFLVFVAILLLIVLGYAIGYHQSGTEQNFKTYSVAPELTYRLGRNTGSVNINSKEYKFFFQEIK